MVSHFQKLFDVNSLKGVYPRMNEVYTKLGEMTNAMKNLHALLELGMELETKHTVTCSRIHLCLPFRVFRKGTGKPDFRYEELILCLLKE